MNLPISLMLHGGIQVTAAAAPSDAAAAECREHLHAILEQGGMLLARGGSALQAVEFCACLLEDDTLFNAGRGSVLNEHGEVEMDAAIMDGRDLRAGAVTALRGIANPVALARLVMTHSGHVLLAGEGALQFAQQQGMLPVANDYFITAARRQQYLSARTGTGNTTGTIGAVARDSRGDLAAATSTGGSPGKRAGRVGDSPLVGAGVYADNASCAVSATGHGEDFIRTALAKTIADHVELLGHGATQAAQAGIDYLQRKVGGHGGVIVIDAAGRCACHSTPGAMICGWIEHGSPARSAWTGQRPGSPA